MKDVPARRMASVFEFVVTVTVLFHFLTRRYNLWVGLTAALALLTMPRVYGHAHIAGTDMPGMMLWALAALAAWKGLNEPGGGRFRAAVGLLVGLSFLVKMAAVMVLLPILGWIVLSRLPGSFRRDRRSAWRDGVVTCAALLAPLAIAFFEIRRLAALLPEPSRTDLFLHHPEARLGGWILLVPLAVWLIRRAFGRLVKGWPTWGTERPALETWEAIVAIAPAVGWLGNPAWWREALPRLAHYYALSVGREGALPDIRIYYLGETYLFSLPWHNGWVLIGVTVPLTVLAAAALGLVHAAGVSRRDRLPLYFVAHFLTLPALRMLPTPAHDGVRLMLPCFVFLAGLAGWGAIWLADGLAGSIGRAARPVAVRAVVAAVVVGWSAVQLVLIHPFELSYYNRLVGGPAGAHRRGFELSYWYDAFNPPTLRGINAALPTGAALTPTNEYSQVPTFAELQSLGALRPDLRLGGDGPEDFPHVWLLAHDSKANAFSRLLFAMTPSYERRPRQLGGIRVAAVAEPGDFARALALQLLASDSTPPDRPRAPLPDWLRHAAPWLARFWGEGLARPPAPAAFEGVFAWAAADPEGLRGAARALAIDASSVAPGARRLRNLLDRFGRPATGESFARALIDRAPDALLEAVDLMIDRPDDLRRVLTTPGYSDPTDVGEPLERPRGEGSLSSIGPPIG